jgi:sigma-B regulation protein RsbU (phosphoserine phosphatase)
MSQARTVLRDAHGSGQTLVGMLRHVNTTIGDHNSRQMFLTAVVIQLDLTTGEYQLVNAGHPSVLVVHADSTSIEGMPTGPLLGVMEDAQWEVRTGALHAGEALVLYTDGVSEAMSANGDLLGTEKIAEALHASDARDLCAQTVAVAEAFQDGPIRDDLTVLAVRWLGETL